MVRNVTAIAQQQLQGVLARRKRQCSFGLRAAKVHVVGILGNRLIQRGQLGVNQQVMMPGVGY